MDKLKLTKGWRQQCDELYVANVGDIILECTQIGLARAKTWYGSAHCDSAGFPYGSKFCVSQASRRKAQDDAERLAAELAEDILFAAQVIVDKFSHITERLTVP